MRGPVWCWWRASVVKVTLGRASFVWTGGGGAAAARCPVCRFRLDPTGRASASGDFGVNLCPSNVMNDRNVRMKRRQARNPSRNPGIRKRNPAEAVSTSFPRVRVRRDRDAVTRMHPAMLG